MSSILKWETLMPRGSKAKYTGKQKRQAEHIAEGYKERGVSAKTAKARAWATVNAESGGGEKAGSGRGRPKNMAPSRKGGRIGGPRGGRAAASRPAAARSASARKAARTRSRRKGGAKRKRA